MAPPPGPYSGTSSLALVTRASAFSFGLVYMEASSSRSSRRKLSLEEKLKRSLIIERK